MERPASISLDAAASALGVSRRSIYNYIREGRLRAIRSVNGVSQRVTVESLQQFKKPKAGKPPLSL